MEKAEEEEIAGQGMNPCPAILLPGHGAAGAGTWGQVSCPTAKPRPHRYLSWDT